MDNELIDVGLGVMRYAQVGRAPPDNQKRFRAEPDLLVDYCKDYSGV
ncbi:MAG TPA: hypothetical protein VJ323_00965 [Bryobacteraceae bacterium]|nr:hypothetical protein [Bryobacteraceae bacterium]